MIFLSDQRIIDCLKTDYGIDVVRLTRIPLGADMNAAVYKAEAQEKSSYFVKLKRTHDYDVSIAIIELLRKAHIRQIIPPVLTCNGQSIQYLDKSSLIVYPFIEGQDGFSRSLTGEQWITLGKTLRNVHDIDVPSSIGQHIRQETFSPQWRQAVRSHYNNVKTQRVEDETAAKLVAFMEDNKETILHLADQAEQLAKMLCNEPLKFVLCHGDIHGGNILIDKNNNIYIVDWDEPLMAPKERDLMFIGGGVGNVWNNPFEETLFYQGYCETKVNMKILAYYRCERIVEDIAHYSQNLLSPTLKSSDKTKLYKHFMEMFEPRGVVDIALGNS